MTLTTYVIRAFGGTLVTTTPTPPSGNALSPLVYATTNFRGVGMGLPILIPIQSPYMVNGTILSDQPGTCTAPFVTSSLIPVGSTFTLIFSSPSNATQTNLANGSTITFTFALADGSMATGPVSVSSTLTGSTFVCFFTVTQNIIHHL
jgi:hypothetical protein